MSYLREQQNQESPEEVDRQISWPELFSTKTGISRVPSLRGESV